MESYTSDHSHAKFSHGMCPTCGAKFYGDLWPGVSRMAGKWGRLESALTREYNIFRSENMLHAASVVAAVLLAGGFAVGGPAPLTFEVASVKPAAPCCAPGQWRESKAENDRIDFRYVTVKYCVAFAYGMKEYQVSGPAWLGQVRYDIVAKGPEGTRREQLPEMMRTLLAERFKLEIHHEQKEFNVFALVAAKSGARMKTGPEQEGAPEGAAFAFSMSEGGVGKMEARHCDMTALANTLPRLVGRPVVDQTGIAGRYDFDLEFSREDMSRLGVPDAPMQGTEPVSSIFTSIRQIGLKLEPRKMPLDAVVVDKGEKLATEN